MVSNINRGLLQAATYLVDQAAGDPEWFPHPVRLIGWLTAHGEQALRQRSTSNKGQFISGTMLTAGIVTATYYATRICIRQAYKTSTTVGISIEILLGWTCLAARNLEQEAATVQAALRANNISLARQRLGRIVGRDTHALDASEISRALIETLAESASDGVIAPLFYMLLGGVPLAMTYKAINTLDSMIGHADEHYFYFGKTAARLDDVANYLPARITGLLIVCASYLVNGCNTSTAWKTWRRDGHKHKSPNAGQPESAMAGALQVQLGGVNCYAGEVVNAQIIGAEFPRADIHSVNKAIRLTALASLLGVVTCVLLSACFADSSRKKQSA